MPTARSLLLGMLRHETRPPRLLYAPNTWQWFAHHRDHGTLPPDLRDCDSQLAMIRHLGLDVFSRNTYCDPRTGWFGGLSREGGDGLALRVATGRQGPDTVTERSYETSRGTLTERQRYVGAASTLVQERFLVTDPEAQWPALEALVQARRWRFDAAAYRAAQAAVGDDGLVVAGELFSPLKLLHLCLGPVQSVYFVTDRPDRARALCARHEEAQLDLLRQMLAAGVPAVMAMDNLDAVFHPPDYVERFSASFYERAATLCHAQGAGFWIHACGRQRANLARIAALGVDGLEGVAYPPLGDVSLAEALALTPDRFLVTGGISAHEFETLRTRAAVTTYVRELVRELWPLRHRFLLSASCNTPTSATWEQLLWFRDAWRRYQGGAV